MRLPLGIKGIWGIVTPSFIDQHSVMCRNIWIFEIIYCLLCGSYETHKCTVCLKCPNFECWNKLCAYMVIAVLWMFKKKPVLLMRFSCTFHYVFLYFGPDVLTLHEQINVFFFILFFTLFPALFSLSMFLSSVPLLSSSFFRCIVKCFLIPGPSGLQNYQNNCRQ